ncbi:hypothetical protein [Aequorivita capsosiphonis]|uniref:hypothetical protein n=1 Tax=Aequorivita capsosiphonis TaxID=487317 RepID=UPI0003FC44D9|nr:hypothetical protein [Aequorivita capsosiphonis]
MEITISGNDRKLLQQVEALARRLGLEIESSTEKEKVEKDTESNSESLYQLMEEMEASGGITSI